MRDEATTSLGPSSRTSSHTASSRGGGWPYSSGSSSSSVVCAGTATRARTARPYTGCEKTSHRASISSPAASPPPRARAPPELRARIGAQRRRVRKDGARDRDRAISMEVVWQRKGG